jgi:hypothetical protein
MSRSTSAYWWENFDSMAGNKDYPFDVPFELNRQTPNGWTANNGMFINGMFSAAVNKTTYGMALQMQGRGLGTMSLIDPADKPQGIGTVSFSARLAQYLEFGDFYYYVDGTGSKNYAISAKAAMTNRKQAHCDISTGSPTLSLVTYYRPGKGCYELRISRVYSTYNNLWDANGVMEMAIYKWYLDEASDNAQWSSKKLTSLRLGGSSSTYNPQLSIGRYYTNGSNKVQFQNYFVPPANSDTNQYNNADWTSIYFGAYNNADGSVYLEGGVGGKPTTTTAYDDLKNATGIMMSLSVTDSDEPFLKGAYGVCSRECPATFGNIQKHTLGGKGPYKGSTAARFGTGQSEQANIDAGDWGSTSPNRIVPWDKNTKNDYSGTYSYGLCAASVSQKLYLKTAPSGDASNWTDTGLDITLTSYIATNLVFSPRTTTPANIQISVGGNQSSPRTDVVIDDIQLSQWAGDSSQSSDLGSISKWAFTDAWVAGSTNDVYQGAGSKAEDPTAYITPCGYYVKQLNDTEFIYVFTNTTAGALSNYATFVPKYDMIVKELFVLGAGGGGGPGGGGGGGGNAIWVTNDVEYAAGEEGITVYVGNGGSGGSKTYSNMDPGNSGSGGTSYVKLKNPLKPSSVQTYSGYGGGAGGAYESGRTNGVNSASSVAGGGGSACKSTVSAKGSAAYASGFGGKAADGAPGGGGGGGLRGIRPSDGSNSASTSPSSVIFAGTNGMDGIAGAYGGKGGDGFPVSALGESEIRYAIAELVAGDKDADI